MAEKEVLISKRQKIFMGAFALSFVCLLIWNNIAPGTKVILLADEPLEVYVASTLKDTYKGLGGRDDLGGKDGMLFLFEFPAKHGIVMRGMRFPIDIVWLYNGEVVDMAPAIPTELGVPEYSLTSYRPREDATMVLELPAGWAAEHGLKVGDALRIP